MNIYSKSIQPLTPEQKEFIEKNLQLHKCFVGWYRLIQANKTIKEDLCQEAFFGLVDAYKKYDPAKGSFAHYATIWMRHRIFRYFRKNFNLIRWPDYRFSKLLKADLTGQSDFVLSLGEQSVKSLYFDPVDPETYHPILEEDPYSEYSSEQIQKAFLKLSSKYREVLIRRLGLNNNREETLKEIGFDFHVSREMIRIKQRNALRLLKLYLSETRDEHKHTGCDSASEGRRHAKRSSTLYHEIRRSRKSGSVSFGCQGSEIRSPVGETEDSAVVG